MPKARRHERGMARQGDACSIRGRMGGDRAGVRRSGLSVEPLRRACSRSFRRCAASSARASSAWSFPEQVWCARRCSTVSSARSSAMRWPSPSCSCWRWSSTCWRRCSAGSEDFDSAFKLAVYSYTPVWLAGIFLLLPGLRFLILLGFYGAYVLVARPAAADEIARAEILRLRRRDRGLRLRADADRRAIQHAVFHTAGL